MRRILTLTALLAGTACAGRPGVSPNPAAAASASGAGASDATAELLAAERAFMDATHRRGVEGWVSFFADDGAQLPDNGPAVVGRSAIRRHMAGAFTNPNVQRRWTPTRAVVAAAGDLGYTYGTWRVVRRSPAGSERVTSRGNYVTVWKRDAAGRWRIAVDGASEEP